ncbi:MAG: hypothetical protein Q4F54_04020 [Coriobacteriia bacterium]|nr:hypothetical protein [Coriobacteriia bacterium]
MLDPDDQKISTGHIYSFTSAGVFHYGVNLWPIPVMDLNLHVTSDVPEGHKVSLGEKILFTVEITNNSSVPVRATQ